MAKTTMNIANFSLTGISAGGSSKYSDFVIDNSLIENGTINSVTVKITVQETKRTMWAKATAYIGYLNSSGGRVNSVTISDVPRKNESAKTDTYGPFTPVKYNGNYYISIGAKNNIATINDINVSFSNITVDIDYTLPHTHSYDTTEVIKKPTCSITGMMKHTCSCGDYYHTSIPTTDHNYNSVVVQPTVNSHGYTGHTCTGCGDYYEDNFTYLVRWYNEDGSALLETDPAVPYGTMPEYNGATPTKAATAQHSYTHIGWAISPTAENTTALTAVVANIDYYARFSSSVNEYQVEWLNDDGTVLKDAEWVPYGDPPSYDGPEPTKPDSLDGKYTYKFLGWSVKDVDDGYYDESELEPVTGHITYEAVFLPAVRKYSLTIFSDDCTVQGAVSGDYDYGTEFTIKAIPDFGYKVSSIYFFDNKDLHIYEGDELTFMISDHTLVRPEASRLPAPIFVSSEQQVKEVYIVPAINTIVYIVDGDLPTLEITTHTVDDLHFDVINTDIDSSKYADYLYYPIEQWYVNDKDGNRTRVW